MWTRVKLYCFVIYFSQIPFPVSRYPLPKIGKEKEFQLHYSLDKENDQLLT